MLYEVLNQASSAIESTHTVKTEVHDNPLHNHDAYEIYLFLSGDVDYFVDKSVYRMEPGHLMLLRSDEFHRYILRSNQPYEKMAVRFDPLLAANTPLLACFDHRPRGEKLILHLEGKECEQLAGLIDRLHRTPAGLFASSMKLALLLELLVCVNGLWLAQWDEGNCTALQKNRLSEKLAPILTYIDSHLSEELSLAAIGKRFFLHPSYLSAWFKEETGVNLHEYIVGLRVLEAKRLLREGANVTEACHSSGFRDYANFIRTFKKTAGISPGQYKKRYR